MPRPVFFFISEPFHPGYASRTCRTSVALALNPRLLPGGGWRPAALTLTLGEPACSPCRAGWARRRGSQGGRNSIGEFARRSRLSLKALRLYDERGVLVPSRVDQASGTWTLLDRRDA